MHLNNNKFQALENTCLVFAGLVIAIMKKYTGLDAIFRAFQQPKVEDLTFLYKSFKGGDMYILPESSVSLCSIVESLFLLTDGYSKGPWTWPRVRPGKILRELVGSKQVFMNFGNTKVRTNNYNFQK